MALLTVAAFREFVTTELGDAPLQTLLDAAEQAITAILGPVSDYGRTETHDGGRSSIITLDAQADSIETVTETVGDTVTTLDADDYLLRNDRRSLERLANGTNPPGGWGWAGGRSWSPWQGRVTVGYTGFDDLARRRSVQRGLVELDLNQAGGTSDVSSERIGEFSETFATRATGGDYLSARAALLDSLLSVGWSFS